MRIFRVTVRGWFLELTEPQRAALRAEAAAHDVVSVGAFTEAGTLTYERSLHTFTFRVQVRVTDDAVEAAPASPEERATRQATALALRAVDALGVAHHRVRATATDMATIWA